MSTYTLRWIKSNQRSCVASFLRFPWSLSHPSPSVSMQLSSRDPQKAFLHAALTSPRSTPIFIHGPPATAKFATLEAALSPTADETHVDCVLAHNDRLLFSAIRGQECSSHPSDLVAAFSEHKLSNHHAIVFHRAERLTGPNFSASSLSALFRLPQLCNSSYIRLIFISRAPWHVFRAAALHHLPEPITIFFPPFSEQQIVTILSECYDPARMSTEIPSEHAERANQFYPAYVKSVVSVLYPTTADLHELRGVCDDLYPSYISCGKSPIASFNVVQDKLRKSLHNLYSRQMIPSEEQPSTEHTHRPEERHRLMDRDLSRTALTLLVAAFLASRNPPTHDMRYFTTERTGRIRGRGRGRGRRRGSGRGDARLATARVFSLERLLAIYAAIRVDDDELVKDVIDVSASSALSTSCLVQISTLVALGYLARDSGGDLISEPKYRSNVTDDQAQAISDLLRIELYHYWHRE